MFHMFPGFDCVPCFECACVYINNISVNLHCQGKYRHPNSQSFSKTLFLGGSVVLRGVLSAGSEIA